jgi:murein L,D-transpeptidase YafK
MVTGVPRAAWTAHRNFGRPHPFCRRPSDCNRHPQSVIPRRLLLCGEGLGRGKGEGLRGLSARKAEALYRPPVLRSVLASTAIAAAVALAGCDTNKILNISGRHMQPLSEEMLAELDAKNMAKESAILIRIFKEESELELWKADKSRHFALLRTYAICRWSGELGPKIQEGDRQAPEGFYSITPSLMNPNSNYHLAINTGFPNVHDRANNRSGSALMIHGDCASVGCYAMTDEQISEIYSLAREAFFGGQRSFQVQAYPFRMTPLNMARHRNSPHLAFWKVLKQGYDHFEVKRKEPKVAVCDKHYVFDARSSGEFDPLGPCPAYKVPQQIASAVHDKELRDEIEISHLISRGIPAAAASNGGEGGMNPTFLSALQAHGGPGTAIRTASGTIPARVNPPAGPLPQDTGATVFAIASSAVKPVKVHVASAAPSSSSIAAFFGNLFGSKSDSSKSDSSKSDSTSSNGRESSATQAKQTKPQAPTLPSAARTQTATTTTPIEESPEAQLTPDSKARAANNRQDSPPQQGASGGPPDAGAARTTDLLIGAVPAVPAGSFQNRLSASR